MYRHLISAVETQLAETKDEVDYNPDLFRDELEICKEMVELLPMKINALKTGNL